MSKEPIEEPIQTDAENETDTSCDCDGECDCGDGKAAEEAAEYKEKWQRAMAELENGRKRADQEKAAFSRFALEGFIEDLLPVVDNFYRATEHVPAEQKDSPWVTGIQYIQKNLLDVLEQRGVKEVSVKVGDAFDPSRQEAIGAKEAEGEEDRVLEVVGRGYQLHDRILRPAQVIVSKKAE